MDDVRGRAAERDRPQTSSAAGGAPLPGGRAARSRTRKAEPAPTRSGGCPGAAGRPTVRSASTVAVGPAEWVVPATQRRGHGEVGPGRGRVRPEVTRLHLSGPSRRTSASASGVVAVRAGCGIVGVVSDPGDDAVGLLPLDGLPCNECDRPLLLDEPNGWVVCGTPWCAAMGMEMPLWRAAPRRTIAGQDPNPAGLPRPSHHGLPVPWVIVVAAGRPWFRHLHGGRLLTCPDRMAVPDLRPAATTDGVAGGHGRRAGGDPGRRATDHAWNSPRPPAPTCAATPPAGTSRSLRP